MGIFSALSIKNLSLTDEKAWNPSIWNLYGSQSLSGEVVTESTALTYAAVWCAVNLYASTISTLPLQLLRKEQNSTIQAKEQRIYRVLHDEFNPYMTAENGRAVMMAHLLTWGNCFAEKVTNGIGEIFELWPISPNRVRIDMKDGILIYRIMVDNVEYVFTRDKILHIPGLGFDGFQGYSVIAMARKSIGLAMAMETFGSKYFGEGTHPSVIVKHPGQLSPTGHSNLKQSLTETYSGLGQSHRLMLLEEGMDIEKVSIPPEDSQFLQSREFQIPEVARWFNLPPHKLKDLTRSSFSNIESEQISFVTDSILPWLIRLEQNYALQILSFPQRKQGFFFRHNVDGLLRGSAKDRAEYYRIMRNIGAMSPNDIREKEDMDPKPDGDKYFVQVNEIPLDKVDEYWKKQIKKDDSNQQLIDNLKQQIEILRQSLIKAEQNIVEANNWAIEAENAKIKAEEQAERERQIRQIIEDRARQEKIEADKKSQQLEEEKNKAEKQIQQKDEKIIELNERIQQAEKERHETEKALIKAEKDIEIMKQINEMDKEIRLKIEAKLKQVEQEKAEIEQKVFKIENLWAKFEKPLIKFNEYLDRQNGKDNKTETEGDKQNALQKR